MNLLLTPQFHTATVEDHQNMLGVHSCVPLC